MPQYFALIFLALALPALVGCQSPLARSVPEQRLIDSGEYSLLPGVTVPPVRGVAGCGAQALAAILAYQNPALDPAALADELPWHDAGATPVDLLLAARGRGFTATIARGSWEALNDAIARKQPVLVMFDAAWQVRTLTGTIPASRVMHWGIVTGVAHDANRLLIAAENARHHVVDRADFEERWDAADNCLIEVEGTEGPKD